jgi:Uma2 family endonuclease
MSEARRRATYEDILALPPHLTGEIVNGELFALPRPVIRHSRATGELHDELGAYRERRGGGGRGGGPGGWHLLIEPELHLADDVLVPDLAAWRIERLPSLPDHAAMELAPDWVCEVLSPRTARLDRIYKMDRYAAHGVGHVWLVDPSERTLEVFRLGTGLYVRVAGFAGDGPARAEPFEGVALTMAEWWLPGLDERGL